jgi:uncharacterized protein YuzE
LRFLVPFLTRRTVLTSIPSLRAMVLLRNPWASSSRIVVAVGAPLSSQSARGLTEPSASTRRESDDLVESRSGARISRSSGAGLGRSEVVETKDLDENSILDLDRNGNICGITIEHARERTETPTFSYEQITA